MAARFPSQSYEFNYQPQWPLETKPKFHDDDDLSVLDEKILDPTTPNDPSAAPDMRNGQFEHIGQAITTRENMWNDAPQELAGHHVRHHSYPVIPHLQTGHSFVRMDPAYAAAYTQPHHLPMSTNSGTSTPTPTTTYDHAVPQAFHPDAPMQYQGDHYNFSQPPNVDPHSAIPMSPQSSQGGWMSATSSDTAEPRSRPVRSPSYRATSPMSHMRQDGIRKKNARFEIPAERNLHNIDTLIMQTQDEAERKELKQQKRLLRNRQAALDSRQRKKQHTEKLEIEKKNFTQELNNLEEQRQELEDILHQEREQRMHQQQQIDHYIRQLEFERDEAIRTKTLETAELRKMNNILKGHIRDFERQQALSLHNSNNNNNGSNNNNNNNNNPPPDFSNDFSSFNSLGIDDNHWDDDFSLIDNSDLHMDHAELPAAAAAAPQAPAPPAPKPADSKNDMPFSWNAFYMCLLFGAFIASTSNSSTTSASLQASIPPLSDEYRVESANVLKAVLASSPESSHNLLPSHGPSLGGPAPTTISGAEMAHMSSHPSQHATTTNLDALHHSLTTPSRHQQETAAFSLSAASYNHLTNPEDPDPFLSNPSDEYLDAKPTPLQAAYASMQEARQGVDRVIGGNLYERSLLWERVPEKVIRDFRKMVKLAEEDGIKIEQ